MTPTLPPALPPIPAQILERIERALTPPPAEEPLFLAGFEVPAVHHGPPAEAVPLPNAPQPPPPAMPATLETHTPMSDSSAYDTAQLAALAPTIQAAPVSAEVAQPSPPPKPVPTELRIVPMPGGYLLVVGGTAPGEPAHPVGVAVDANTLAQRVYAWAASFG